MTTPNPTTKDQAVQGGQPGPTTTAQPSMETAPKSESTFGRNSRGEPEMYPSDIQGLTQKYNLTIPEAEQVWQRTVVGNEDEAAVADELAKGRVWYRVHYEQVQNPADNALTRVQVEQARIKEEADTARAKQESRNSALTAPTADRTQPAAGPHGPYAEYTQVTVPVEEVAHNTGLSVDQVKEAGLDKTNTGGK